MATLVLTAVGTAIGGPIGGAIGAMIGRTVDSELLFRPKGREGPRLTELSVQTSSYGTQIPKLFGTMRVAGSVIWATDLVEHRTRSGGGKGRPSVTSYSYTASFAVALSARAILGVGRIWADGKLLRGAAGDWKSAATFRLHNGGEDQPADPLIASAEGAGLTPAHRGMAYAVFEDLALEDFGNRIPSLTFEVTADAGPVSIGTIAEATSGGVVRDAGAAALLDGFSAYGDTARAVIDTLGQIGGCRFAPVGDGIEMRGPGAGAVLTVEDAGAAGEKRARSIRPIEAVAQAISVAHYDPARDYQTGVQRATRPGAGSRRETIDVPAAIGAGAAKAVATAMLARAEAERVHRRIVGDASAITIGPGDRVAITGENGRWRVASASLERMATTLELVAERAATLPAMASSGRALPAPDAVAGATILDAFELPALDEALLSEPRLTIVAAGTAPGWRRAALSYSFDDGASWTSIGATAAPATLGALIEDLPEGTVTLRDQRGAIIVELAHDGMSLRGADPAALDRGANLALVGDELVQFATAEQLAPRRWRLGDLSRGRRGTIATGHDAGARFVLIEPETAVAITLSASPGQRLRVAADAVADTAEIELALTGASILPPSPVHLRAEAQPDGGALLRWRRRARSGWRWRDGADAPLGEEREQYRVTVMAGALPPRIVETAAPAVAVTAAERAGGPVSISIVQIGTNGASPPATIII
ncbi:phage tail protein [uncultured Sphingomonas sp.]|uniref:GTA baseplate fiber-binding domain-containing protein n=1 Tax=uncultured Sphingomonas sp. TaxID=158754 RepID=UPI00260A520C|nr:phage tail protein [uncultured Sphingomonas sp.]